MKQTAVEWLISQLQKTRDYQRVINEANQSGSSVRDVIQQAKEMERQQIMNAVDYGTSDWGSYKDPEVYYNETYNNKTK